MAEVVAQLGQLLAMNVMKTVMMMAAVTMPSSLMNLSTTSRALRPFEVEKTKIEARPARPVVRSADSRRLRANFSWKAAATTCMRETSEVNPAMTRVAKNATPKTGPPGMSEIIAGR